MATTIEGTITRTRVLQTAATIINKQGARNTSIKKILEATAVKKGNLQFHFSSEEDLGLAILKGVENEFFQFLLDNLRSEGPLQKLSNVFDAILEKHRKTKFVRGCVVGDTALEMSDNNPRFAAAVQEIFSRQAAILTGILMQARESGHLNSRIPPAVLAKHILAAIEGGIMMARVSKSEGDLKDCLN